MAEIRLASLSLTHVFYNPNDPYSYICAWLALIPQALCVMYVTLIWSTREVEIALMFAGQMGCEAFNFALKRVIKQERPQQMNGKGYGMPSSHAQFLAYFSVSLTLFLLIRHQPLTPPLPASLRSSKGGNIVQSQLAFYQRALLSVAVLSVAAAVAASRVYLSYHTPMQVLIGCAAGALSAVIWFIFTTLLRSQGWVEWGLDTWLAHLGRWRDLVVQEDLVEGGWIRWKELKKTRPKRCTNGTARDEAQKDR